MSDVRVIPILPCRDLADVVPFYEALGFALTYRQQRPNPYAGLRRDGIELHFFSLPEFEPETSLGSVGLAVRNPGALYASFAAGLRAAYGKVPVAGVPRMTRPRRRQGAPAGFTVVDPGGNWLRISRLGDADDGSTDASPTDGRLSRVLATAARQADSHGDEGAAIRVLENGLDRHADAPSVERIPVLVYLAELRLRTVTRQPPPGCWVRSTRRGCPPPTGPGSRPTWPPRPSWRRSCHPAVNRWVITEVESGGTGRRGVRLRSGGSVRSFRQYQAAARRRTVMAVTAFSSARNSAKAPRPAAAIGCPGGPACGRTPAERALH